MNEEIIELAREVWPGKVIETEQLQQELQRFNDLAIAAEHKRLLAGSGEPHCINVIEYRGIALNKTVEDPLYTSEQQAAAVLREMERICSLIDGYPDWIGKQAKTEILAAIRGMQ